MKKKKISPQPPFGPLTAGRIFTTQHDLGFRPDGTRDWELITTVSGSARFGYHDGQLLVSEGDVVLVRPGTPHDYGAVASGSNWEMQWVHFIPRTGWLDWLDWPAAAPGLLCLGACNTEEFGRIVNRIGEIVILTGRPDKRAQDFAMNALEEVLLWCDSLNPKREMADLDPRIRQAIKILCRNISQKISNAELALRCHLSPSRLGHLFQQQVGKAPQQFLEMQKMQRASELLALTCLPVQLIAEEVGFDEPFYFSRRFRWHCGLSPAKYRRKFKRP